MRNMGVKMSVLTEYSRKKVCFKVLTLLDRVVEREREREKWGCVIVWGLVWDV